MTQIVTYNYILTDEGLQLFLKLLEHIESNKNLEFPCGRASWILRKFYLREAYEAVSYHVAYS